jgi:K(+)-stimulated pyrophosphate-energized sodium pump
MQEIAAAIQEGAMAYLSRQYRTVAMVAVVLAIAIAIPGFFGVPGFGLWTAIGFLLGGGASAAAGFIGMGISVKANVRTAEAARGGLAKALTVAFEAGSVTGLFVVGLGILSVSLMALLVTFGVAEKGGPSASASWFASSARSSGGGIFTKAVDWRRPVARLRPAFLRTILATWLSSPTTSATTSHPCWRLPTCSRPRRPPWPRCSSASLPGASGLAFALGLLIALGGLHRGVDYRTFFVKKSPNGTIMGAHGRRQWAAAAIAAVAFYPVIRGCGFLNPLGVRQVTWLGARTARSASGSAPWWVSA